MAAFNKFDKFTDALARGVLAFNSDTIKLGLSNTTPNLTTGSVYGDITEISAANGYSAGGQSAGTLGVNGTAGTENISGGNVVFVASGGSFGPFQFAVLYDSSKSRLIGYYDYGSSISLNNGETFTIAPAGGIWFSIT